MQHQDGRVECLLEEMAREAGYVMIHDGQFERGNSQFETLPRFFTRHYRKVRKSQFVDQWEVFCYDRRTGYCVDVRVTKRDPVKGKIEQRIMTEQTEEKLAQIT